MRFNPEIVRSVLISVEEIPAGESRQCLFHDDEGRFSDAEMNRHAEILVDEAYIDGDYLPGENAPIEFSVRDLTMKGHEFLANARNNTVWKQVVAKAEKEGTTISLSVLNGLLRKAMQKYVGLGDDE